MSRFKLAFSNGGLIIPPDVPEIPDLVTLGILSKPISEYTDADIGSIISIPYNDDSGKILLNNGCIEFEVVGVNHHKDINDESKPTITLMTKNVIRTMGFDAQEPDNPLHDRFWGEKSRSYFGNNRWSVSNIRQWLNSEGDANEWFTKRHEYDAEPDYINDPGFLAGFNDGIKQHFVIVKNKTLLCNSDKTTLYKDFDETEDKVFLPSITEMCSINLENKPEGIHIAKFNSDNSRIKTGANNYWLRSPALPYGDNEINGTSMVFCIRIKW